MYLRNFLKLYTTFNRSSISRHSISHTLTESTHCRQNKVKRRTYKTNTSDGESVSEQSSIHRSDTSHTPSVGIADSYPPEVTSTVGLADSSSNYLSLKSNATPRDRGNSEGVEDLTSSGKPVADLREAKGEVNKEADGRTGPRVESYLQNNEGTSGGDPDNITNECESTSIDRFNSVHLYKTPSSAAVFSDISRLDSMTPRELRVFVSDVVEAKVDDLILWSKISSYCIKNSSKFKFFDALSVLSSFNSVKIYDKILWIDFSRVLSSQAPQMEPSHIVQAINVYYAANIKPDGLFLELFYNLMKNADKMYAKEYVDVFLCLVKWHINNQQLLNSLSQALSRNITVLRYADLTQIMAAVRSLEISDETFYFILDSWQEKELKMMTIQELLDSCKVCLYIHYQSIQPQILQKIKFKWPPYEKALHDEFIENDDDINQLEDPFNCLDFLRLNNLLSKQYLFALSKWCSNAVYKPPTRSQKRPLTYQLVQLYNLIKEYDVDDTYIDKAILKYVTSKGLQTWFVPGNTPQTNISQDARKAHGRASMFFAGFIMLTPHRIAMTCAPHILKRYHLPPDVVGLFIYKIHAPMELSGLIGQLLTNIILWICRYSGADRRIFRSFSIGFTWLMFFSTVLSFILLYSGDDYGKFNEFFWSIILMTLTNGLYCASTFKLEGIIASMYGAGIPSSGFFTFFLHKFCEWSSIKFDWEDFDHNILLIQYCVTIITLFISSTIWTVDIGMDIHDTKPGGSSNNSIDFGNPAETAKDVGRKLDDVKGKYEVKLEETSSSGYTARPGGTITVTQVQEQSGNNFKGYRHHVTGGTTFSINRITIHNQVTKGISQSDIEGITFQDSGGVYVYYSKEGDNNLQRPYLICLSKNGQPASSPENIWYSRTNSNPNTWANAENFGTSDDPNIINTFETQLNQIKSGLIKGVTTDTGYPPLDSVEIDISTAPTADGATNGGFYRSAGITIEVRKQTVNQSVGGSESQSWRCYKHFKNPSGPFKLKKITHSDKLMESTDGSPQLKDDMNLSIEQNGAIYVYYKSRTDIRQPKVICIDEGNKTRHWYAAGNAANNWTNADSHFIGKDPSISTGENAVTETELNNATPGTFTPSGTTYKIKLDKRPLSAGVGKKIKYRTGDKEFTFERTNGDATGTNGVPEHYVRYTHKPDSGTFDLNLVKHNDQELKNITGTNVTAVYVYYRGSGQDDEHQFPLIVCVKTGQNSQTYHKRGNNWAEENNLKVVDPDGLDPDKEPPTKGINQLFEGGNDGHATDWSPISMLATSLGSVYFFYPSISPYSLVDPDVGKKIDLWILFTAAIPNFGVALLDIIDGELYKGEKCGPSGKHWYGTGDKVTWPWQLSWIAFLPYVLCIYIFLSLMHFPDGWISRKINGNPIVIGLIGNTFNFFQEWMESIGFAGAGAQTGAPDKPGEGGGLQLRPTKPIPTVYKPNRKYIYTEDVNNPRKEPVIKYIDEISDVNEPEKVVISEMIKEMEPYPRFVEGISDKKPSTQSCGKASFRLKPKTTRHKNLPVQ